MDEKESGAAALKQNNSKTLRTKLSNKDKGRLFTITSGKKLLLQKDSYVIGPVIKNFVPMEETNAIPPKVQELFQLFWKLLLRYLHKGTFNTTLILFRVLLYLTSTLQNKPQGIQNPSRPNPRTSIKWTHPTKFEPLCCPSSLNTQKGW